MNGGATALITRRLISVAHERAYGKWLAELLEFLHSLAGYDGATLLSSQDKLVRMIVVRFRSPEALIWHVTLRRSRVTRNW